MKHKTSGTNQIEVAEHIRDALQAPLPGKLIKIRREKDDNGWYDSHTECNKNAKDEYSKMYQKDPDCDEYPFGSTVEGGPAGNILLKAFGFPGVSLRLLDRTQNRSAGNSLKEFYSERRGQVL